VLKRKSDLGTIWKLNNFIQNTWAQCNFQLYHKIQSMLLQFTLTVIWVLWGCWHRAATLITLSQSSKLQTLSNIQIQTLQLCSVDIFNNYITFNSKC
jgi:hypothetical protein